MHGLFFEMRPKPGHLPHYFAHVDRLKPVLAQHAGLWFLDRYRSLDDPELILSHQHWADDAAIASWRRDTLHCRAQEAGRRVHFEDYRIRVGPEVMRWTPDAGVAQSAAPADRLVLTVHAAAVADLPGARGFASVNRTGAVLTLAEAATLEAASGLLSAAAAARGATAVHGFAVSRDYGLTRRHEAPG